MTLQKIIKRNVSYFIDPRETIKETIDLEFNNNSFVPIDNSQDQDIFVVGFPKSGNTWMQSLISGILYGIDTKYLSDSLAQEIVPDVHARKYYKRFGNLNFFKSHHLPQKHYKKVIYLVRDGRDAMVSYYAMLQNLNREVSLANMIKKGEGIIPCKWNDHILKWEENPFNSEIITIRYEDLLENPIPELNKICEFADIKRSHDELEKVIEGNSFEIMKKKVKMYNGMGHKDWIGDKASLFFRRGVSGSYLDEMPIELITSFNKESQYGLKKYGYNI